MLRRLALAGALSVAACGVAAQDATQTELQSQILVIDQDRLLAETRLGSQALARLEAQEQALASENKKIEAELIDRERELTELRPETAPEDFRVLADEFDARVERIRAEQDEKERALNRNREEARQDFLQEVAGVVSEIVREKRAVVVIDRRAVFLSASSIDITDEAIARVNASVE